MKGIIMSKNIQLNDQETHALLNISFDLFDSIELKEKTILNYLEDFYDSEGLNAKLLNHKKDYSYILELMTEYFDTKLKKSILFNLEDKIK